MRQANKQPAGVFVVEGGRVIAGRDPILVLLEVAPGGCDLLFPREIPDGVYRLNRVTGVPHRVTKNSDTIKPEQGISRASTLDRLKGKRVRRPIKARRRQLSLYGQVAP
jgi:hypothetical protein